MISINTGLVKNHGCDSKKFFVEILFMTFDFKTENRLFEKYKGQSLQAKWRLTAKNAKALEGTWLAYTE